jgi:type 2A phosphatase activator TIP41
MRRGGGLDRQLKQLPGDSTRTILSPGNQPVGASTNGSSAVQRTLQRVCREEIENLHGIFVCWFKGLQPREDLERELSDRITPGFSHVAPNGQFIKGRANLLHNLLDKYDAFPNKAFDIQIKNVKVVWTQDDLCLVTYEEWQWWRDMEQRTHRESMLGAAATTTAAPDDVSHLGRLSSCLLKQRPGCFHWIHVHETWLEGVGPGTSQSLYDEGDNISESSGAYKVEVTYKTGVVGDTKSDIEYDEDSEPNEFKDLGEQHVRFSNQREELSYAYKKVAHEIPEEPAQSIPVDKKTNVNNNHGTESAPTKTNGPKVTNRNNGTNTNKTKEKPTVMLTPVSPTGQAALNASRRRHISPQLTDYAKACMVNNELIGISINGWDIGTGQGPMGDGGWFSAANANFENLAQYRGSTNKELRRRLALPEMVFPAAHIAFEHRQDNLWISWDVLDAMDDWAKAHQRIPVNTDVVNNGVSVLKSGDAELWASKKKNVIPDSKSKEVFHFDWTFSSPFCGSVEGGFWDPLSSSGLRLEMLKDQSIPILFFDELILYEDDLHDNGHVQFSLKIRVMPTCGFVLARLWVRIDRVLLRLRETRVMFEFGKTSGEQTKIFRDVTWRECQFKDLAAHQLPTNLKVWCSEGPETPQLTMLMSKLPEVDLPKGIPKHAILKRGVKS